MTNKRLSKAETSCRRSIDDRRRKRETKSRSQSGRESYATHLAGNRSDGGPVGSGSSVRPKSTGSDHASPAGRPVGAKWEQGSARGGPHGGRSRHPGQYRPVRESLQRRGREGGGR